ncbi:MAG: hypothetical protein LBD44_06335 [Spirochaetaceae bacterium]|nr:hypothetical protein [Spirochaetaceae bacterium]
MVYNVVIKTIVDSIIMFMLFVMLLPVEIKFKNKSFYVNAGKKYQQTAAAVFFVSGICFFTVTMGFPSYLYSLRKEPSTFYEENYIDPNDVEIAFPEKRET